MGQRTRIRAAALLAVVVAVGQLDQALANGPSSSMELGRPTSAPEGYVTFCQRAPAECAARGQANHEVLTAERWRQIEEINRYVNLLVVPVTDLEYYQAEEVWALPGNQGDCEDFVLLKRKWLIEQGWPTGALLITVVFDENGDGHAVLIARTDRGDLVLDNKVDAVRLWSQTPYRFVKTQSTSNPNRWVSVGKHRWHAAATGAP